MAPKTHKVVIIGSGPAGWTAALYAARATLEPAVYLGSPPNTPGGQLMITSEVENFPGFPKGVLGPELITLFQEQAERFGAQSVYENIEAVDFSARPFRLTAESGEIFAQTVIIATGAKAKLIGLPREQELMAAGAGVSACATCDGAFYKNMDVAVVGGGDSAMEEALFLTRFAKSVTIIHRRDVFRASKIMLERAQQHPKIRWQLNAAVSKLLTRPDAHQRDSLYAIEVEQVHTHEKQILEVQGLFAAIGHAPTTDLFKGKLDLDTKGYLVTQVKSTKTNIPGVFACGDVQDSIYRQAITAAGTGCMAAIEAERFLEAEGK